MATGSVAAWSGIRAKKNNLEIQNSLNKILQVRGFTFDRRHEEFPDRKFKQVRDMGVIAQEIEKVFSETVQTAPDGYSPKRTQNQWRPLIQAIKEFYALWFRDSQDLHAQVQAVQAENRELKEALEKQRVEFEARLQRLENQRRSPAGEK